MNTHRIKFVILLLTVGILASCSMAGKKNNKKNSDTTLVNCLQGNSLISSNPHLTEEYLKERRKHKDFIYFVIDTLTIESAVNIFYKQDEFNIRMITSRHVAETINFDEICLWQLLSREDIFIEGLGGSRQIFLSGVANTREGTAPDPNKDVIYLTDKYTLTHIYDTKFLFVILDEATYMMTQAIDGFNAPITPYVLGLPIKMAYSLAEE